MPASDLEPVGLQLARTAKTVTRAFDDVLAAAGGSLPMWLILVQLKSQAHGTQRDIAQAVGVEGPTLTHHLNRMESAGLVTRRRDADNRRIHHVELTETGEAMFFALLEHVAGFDAQLRAGFSDRDLAQLGRLLQRLADNAGRTDGEGAAAPSSLRRGRVAR